MIKLYSHRSGSQECQLIKHALVAETWMKIRQNVCHILKTSGDELAANFLIDQNFSLFEATNGFGDEFYALAVRVGVEEYADFGVKFSSEEYVNACRSLANAFKELDYYVRFVVVDRIKLGEIDLVPDQTLITSSQVVRLALMDARILINQSNLVSAVDRIHMALTGYLKSECANANIVTKEDAKVTELFKNICTHPKLMVNPNYQDHTLRIARSFASVVDSINQLRNSASLAHANETLLDDADAKLVINSTRTIINYIDDKLNA